MTKRVRAKPRGSSKGSFSAHVALDQSRPKKRREIAVAPYYTHDQPKERCPNCGKEQDVEWAKWNQQYVDAPHTDPFECIRYLAKKVEELTERVVKMRIVTE